MSIEVTGEGNSVIVTGGGSLHIGPLSCKVTGEGNRVLIASKGTLKIGGSPTTRPPKVRRGQIWAHNVLARRYQVISVRNGIARCLVTDTLGLPITGPDDKATIQDLSTINLRYAYALVSG